jgi:hypothetical protein
MSFESKDLNLIDNQKQRGCEKIKSAFSFWRMAYSLVCDSVLKLLIQVKYEIKPEI